MPCYRVNEAWLSRDKRVSFGKELDDSSRLRFPCGRCFGCRMDRVRSWSVRCQHEASCWDFNSFLTLTYDEAHVPWHGGLVADDVQRWLKRLRKVLSGVQEGPDGRKPLRFFLVGEYGERTSRPHYHALLFNCRLSEDRRVGKRTFESDVISETWDKGGHQVGSVTPASASYVAGYAMKKVYGSAERQSDWYSAVDVETGEVVEREREFCRMSLKPGIGSMWYDKFHSDLRQGFVVRDGQKFSVPRYYRRKLQLDAPLLAEEADLARARHFARVDVSERGEERLAAAEKVAEARRKMFARS